MISVITGPIGLPSPWRHIRWLALARFGQDFDLEWASADDAMRAHKQSLSEADLSMLKIELAEFIEVLERDFSDEDKRRARWAAMGAGWEPSGQPLSDWLQDMLTTLNRTE